MKNYKYISIPISYIEENNLSKQDFLENSDESKVFLNSLLKALPSYLEIKNLFLIKSNFIVALGNSQNIKFENESLFVQFCEFIENTNFYEKLNINKTKKEISTDSDISPIFYNLLYEFLV